jgi:predicted nucleic acid-binding protein
MSGVLVDTSVWVRHFRRADPVLRDLLLADTVLTHPLVVLELACGTPPSPRKQTLAYLQQLRAATTATADEILALVERKRLYDSGCGAVDISLLAATLLTSNARLWTQDRSLAALARRFGVAYEPAPH